jgi:hypothetical protein
MGSPHEQCPHLRRMQTLESRQCKAQQAGQGAEDAPGLVLAYRTCKY